MLSQFILIQACIWARNRKLKIGHVKTDLSGSHRSARIDSDFSSWALASQAKPQRESESQAFRIAILKCTPKFHIASQHRRIFAGVLVSFSCDLLRFFLRRFREGISFPNFGKSFILKLLLSKICAVLFAPQNRALFEGENRAKRRPEKGRRAS